jgi:hypothetical protein
MSYLPFRVHTLFHERVDLPCVITNLTQLIVKLPPLLPVHNHVSHVRSVLNESAQRAMSHTTHVDKESEEQAGCADPPQHSPYARGHITSLHCTALRCATRCGRRHAQHTWKQLGFHWPEAVCVFLHAQAAFLPARPKPNHALLPMDPCSIDYRT